MTDHEIKDWCSVCNGKTKMHLVYGLTHVVVLCKSCLTENWFVECEKPTIAKDTKQ